MEKDFQEKDKEQVVHVLLSAFNGERYIREQINSILNQEQVQVNLHIRDDGSTDGTVRIIQEYESEHQNVTAEYGSNIGYVRSFFRLIRDAEGDAGDYYAFSDQDDIWEPDKLISAIRKLKAMNPEKPLLYYSDLNVVDADGNYIRKANSWEGTIDKYKIAMFIGVRGCTEVFNDRLCHLLQNVHAENISSHDTFTALTAFWLGEVVYDPVPHIRYRQTGGNASLTGMSGFDHLKKNLIYAYRRITRRKHMHEKNARELLSLHEKEFPNELDALRKVAFYRESLSGKIRLMRDRRFFRFSFMIRLFNSLFILLGKL